MLDTNDIGARRVSSARVASARAFALAALAAGTVLLGSPRVAHAEEVSPDGKGIIGGAFLGAEVVVFAEALFGVRSTTAYLLGAGGGAIAGGLGGYALETSVDDGRIPALLLAAGLALAIPAIVVTLDQTRYLPTEGAREDRPVNNLPPSDPGRPGGSSVIGAEPKPGTPAPGPQPATTPPSGTTPAPAPVPAPPGPGGGGGGGAPSKANAPQSLFNLREGGFKLGLPLPEVRPVFTVSQRKSFGVENAGSEVRFPVVAVTF